MVKPCRSSTRPCLKLLPHCCRNRRTSVSNATAVSVLEAAIWLEQNNVYPSGIKVAEYTGLSQRTVYRYREEMIRSHLWPCRSEAISRNHCPCVVCFPRGGSGGFYKSKSGVSLGSYRYSAF